MRGGGVAVAAVAVGIAVYNGTTGERPPPQALVPASTVMADAGPSGVVIIRDGTVIRVDEQSPPGRLVIPAPSRAPWPDGLAVGRFRVWVSSQGLVRGYARGGRSVRAVRVTRSEALLLAEGNRVLWAATPYTDVVRYGRLTQRPMRFRGVRVPGAVRDIEARGDDAWVMLAAPRRRTIVARVTAGGGVLVVADLPGRSTGIAAGTRTLWLLNDGGLYRIDMNTLRMAGLFPVQPGTDEVTAGPGRVITVDAETGIALDRTLGGRVFTYNVGRRARAIAGARRGFWVTTGDQATPRFVEYRSTG